MNKHQIKRILCVCRPSGEDAADPAVASAKERAERDPELAEWFAQEQAFDRKFAEALAGTPVPPELKVHIFGAAINSNRQRLRWSHTLVGPRW
jgi:hypothetical protein